MVTPVARREVVAHLRLVHEVSQRRECLTIGADRASIRYRSSRPDDGVIRARLRGKDNVAGTVPDFHAILHQPF